MTRITYDATLAEKLLNLSQPLEICDEAGSVLAKVSPVFNPDEYEPWEPQITKEELDRRMQNAVWLTTEEALAYLEKLGCFR
jgi:hypothetical protein